MDAWEETTGQPRRVEKLEDWRKSDGKSSTSSPLEMEIASLRAQLAPPTLEEATGELLRCLRLTAPVGMTDTDRREWLLVAFDEVKEIPVCEFADRCSHARKVADHPSKIVPAIFAHKFGDYSGARGVKMILGYKEREYANRDLKRLEKKAPEPEEPFDTAKIREEMGFPREDAAPAQRNFGPPREPTAAELAEIAEQFKREQRYPTPSQKGQDA